MYEYTFGSEFGEPLVVDFHVPQKPLKVVQQLSDRGHRQNKTLWAGRRQRIMIAFWRCSI